MNQTVSSGQDAKLPSHQNDEAGSSSVGGLGGVLRLMGHGLPTGVVLVGLAAVGYWGHQTGWQVPKYSELTGRGASKADDWCTAHAVPESACVECRPDLIPKTEDYGWCRQHGVHQCPLCHPDVAQVPQGAQVTQDDLTQAAKGLAFTKRPENNSRCQLYKRRIQFASIDAVRKAGVDVELVDRAPMVETVTANGEITYDETRVAHLSSRVPGVVWRTERSLGGMVQADDVLALIDGVEVGRAKAELLQALADWRFRQATADRLKPLAEEGSVRGSRDLEAQTAVRDARIRILSAHQSLVNLGMPTSIDELQGCSDEEAALRIQFLGLPADMSQRLAPAKTTSNLIPLKSPLNGEVVACHAVAGEVVDAAKVLFTVADTNRVWLTLSVPLEDVGQLKLGQTVHFQPDGPQQPVTGTINWLSTSVDQETRTVQVRADLDNAAGTLRHGTFGSGQIVLREENAAIVVPSNAVQWDGSCYVVFVRHSRYFDEDAPKLFHPRTVRLGAKTEEQTEIIAGVLPGEVVATIGSGVLRGELLKNNLGAG